MELGKNFADFGFLNDLYIEEKIEKPSIVILPTSLVFNWQEEIKKFTPNLRFYNYTGADRDLEEFKKHLPNPLQRGLNSTKKKAQKNKPFHILLTTYGTLLCDIEKLKKIDWYYQILDES